MNWINIEDELPEMDRPVLVTDGGRVWSAVRFMDSYWSCYGYTGYDMESQFGVPIAWCELPKPPKKGT